MGGKQQLLAAVRCGADAVYFGLQGFNARRNAENFGGDDLPGTMAYCHERGVKVFITINTLVLDSELGDMRGTVDTACRAGADGVIVQDLAVSEYIKERWPEVPMVASTQMAVHNVEGVRMLRDMGFKRAVLARELTLPEIKEIYDKTGMELEAFVHGAHCMSLSGACYLSSMIGGRSGNRGLCAQPCRLDCEVCGRDHALSLKDLSYVTHIRELAEAGVSSLKIEGRMKRAEYVAAAVTACKDAIEGRTPDIETLRAVFSRSGFTDGYLAGKRDISMFGYRTKEDVTAAADVLSDLAKLYEKEPQNVPVDMLLYVQEGEPSQLSVSCEGFAKAVGAQDLSVTVLGPEPQKARTLPISEEYARRSLSKTGGTPYHLRDLALCAGEGLMLPSSALNELRRSALEELGKARVEAFRDSARTGSGEACGRSSDVESERLPDIAQKAPERPFSTSKRARQTRTYRARFEGSEQLFSGCPETVVLPLSELTGRGKKDSDPRAVLELAKSFGAKKIIAEIPSVIWPFHMGAIHEDLEKLRGLGIYDVSAENLGAVSLAKEYGFNIHGGMFLNILNSRSLARHLELGLEDACLSFELAFSDMRKIHDLDLEAAGEKGCAERFGAAVYGYIPLMKFRACPARRENGCKGCSGRSILTDRMGEEFTIICREKQYSELLNCVPLYVGDRSIPDLGFELLYFTTESAEECAEIFRLCKEKAPLPGRRTAGLYFRELL